MLKFKFIYAAPLADQLNNGYRQGFNSVTVVSGRTERVMTLHERKIFYKIYCHAHGDKCIEKNLV
jgi:hypothetical protein